MRIIKLPRLNYPDTQKQITLATKKLSDTFKISKNIYTLTDKKDLMETSYTYSIHIEDHHRHANVTRVGLTKLHAVVNRVLLRAISTLPEDQRDGYVFYYHSPKVLQTYRVADIDPDHIDTLKGDFRASAKILRVLTHQ